MWGLAWNPDPAPYNHVTIPLLSHILSLSLSIFVMWGMEPGATPMLYLELKSSYPIVEQL